MQPQHAAFIDTLSQEDWDYLQQLPFSLTLPAHGVVVTHAGLVPSVPLAEQRLQDLIDVRTPTPTEMHRQEDAHCTQAHGCAGLLH